MQANLDQLEQILGQQVAGLTAIKLWIPKKVELVKSHRLAELEAFNKREEEQVVRLQQAESQRQVLLGLIARDLGLERPPTLAELVDLAPPGARERLAARREQLTTLAEQIKAGQTLVDQLLRVSIEFVHYSMDVFAQLANVRPKTGYGDDDFTAPPASASWLVNKHA